MNISVGDRIQAQCASSIGYEKVDFLEDGSSCLRHTREMSANGL
ncbi:hypothetical protein [Paraburkholderia sp. RL17-337-BIB-A]